MKFHKTAISRRNFSTPVQYLLKNDLINKDIDILDFGCGRGYDVEHLDTNGYNILGYDLNGPYSIDWTVLNRKYDFIMSNFVLNVIESIKERHQVVKDIISLLDENGTAYIAVRNDRDVANGVTSTGTWQGLVEPTTQGWELVTKNSKFTMWKYTKVTR